MSTHTYQTPSVSPVPSVPEDVGDVVSTYSSHTSTDVVDDGSTQTVSRERSETLVTPSMVEETAKRVFKDLDNERQKLEDCRANHRNRNRLYILLVAILMTFIVPTVVANVLHDAALLKYSTLIAIVPDGLLTAYAYFRKY